MDVSVENIRICQLINLHGSSPLIKLLDIHFQISMSKPKPSPWNHMEGQKLELNAKYDNYPFLMVHLHFKLIWIYKIKFKIHNIYFMMMVV